MRCSTACLRGLASEPHQWQSVGDRQGDLYLDNLTFQGSRSSRISTSSPMLGALRSGSSSTKLFIAAFVRTKGISGNENRGEPSTLEVMGLAAVKLATCPRQPVSVVTVSGIADASGNAKGLPRCQSCISSSPAADTSNNHHLRENTSCLSSACVGAAASIATSEFDSFCCQCNCV